MNKQAQTVLFSVVALFVGALIGITMMSVSVENSADYNCKTGTVEERIVKRMLTGEENITAEYTFYNISCENGDLTIQSDYQFPLGAKVERVWQKSRYQPNSE